MQALNIILTILGSLAYIVTATFAFFAFSRLKRQEEDLCGMKIVTAKTLALVTAGHLQRSFETLNEMKETLRDLIEDERFEEAEDLKKTIVKMEHCAMRELERFKENFGEDCVDIKVTSIRRD